MRSRRGLLSDDFFLVILGEFLDVPESPVILAST
jgi:hypothetical protein